LSRKLSVFFAGGGPTPLPLQCRAEGASARASKGEDARLKLEELAPVTMIKSRH